MKTEDDDPKDVPFEQILTRLSELATSLEKNDVPLEKALALFEEGVRLSRRAEARLSEAEAKIEELTERGTRAPIEEPAKKR